MMIELCISDRLAISIDDEGKTVVYDKNIANDVECDINGKKIDFELKDIENIKNIRG